MYAQTEDDGAAGVSDCPQVNPRARVARPRESGGRKRLRLRRSSTASSSGQSQETGGDLDIGPSEQQRSGAPPRVPDTTGAAAAAEAEIEPAVLVVQTPVPVLDEGGRMPVTLCLSPDSALELMKRLEGCASEAGVKLASSCVSYVLSNFERVCSAKAFLSLPFRCMEKIIADDALNVSSEDVSGSRLRSLCSLFWIRYMTTADAGCVCSSHVLGPA